MKKTLTHELLAEFFGTFVLVLGGDGVVANVGLAPRLASAGYDWNTIVWGWGLSVMVAVYVAGGVSGAHLNPAVTLALAVKRGFEWKKVLPFMLAQIVGAFVGAFGVYLVYREGLVAAGLPNVWCVSVMAKRQPIWQQPPVQMRNRQPMPVSPARLIIACPRSIFPGLGMPAAPISILKPFLARMPVRYFDVSNS